MTNTTPGQPHSASHGPTSRLNRGGTKLNTLLAMAAGGVIGTLALAHKDQIADTVNELREVVDPTVPTQVVPPRNLAATPGLQDPKDVSDTTEYNNGYENMTHTNLVSAAEVVSGEGRSEDAQAFHSLWDYLTTCGMIVNNQNTFSGTNMTGGFRVEKTIIDKNGNTVIGAPHLYTLEVLTNPKNKRSRIIKFGWRTPHDQNVVNAQGGRTDIVFNGFYEFHQLGENGSIQMYEVDATNGKRIGPYPVSKAELINYLGSIPGLSN